MFKKVLVAEDMDSINGGLSKALHSLGITNFDHAKYCDDALLKVKKARLDNEPYDLLISDLSFIKDHREQKLKSGDELVVAVKNELPNIKTIVFSVEDRKQRVQRLVDKVGVDAFVGKGRNGLFELKKAIEIVYANESYLSQDIAQVMRNKEVLEINEYDINVLQHLANGYNQDQISELFKNDNIKPNSLSSVEKRINKLKTYFKASNTIHLIALTKDIGLI